MVNLGEGYKEFTALTFRVFSKFEVNFEIKNKWEVWIWEIYLWKGTGKWGGN